MGPRGFVVAALATLALCAAGCDKPGPSGKAAIQGECTAAIAPLGLGDLATPSDAPARDQQLGRVVKAVASWETAKSGVKTPGVRTRADAIAAALSERKDLLAASTGAPGSQDSLRANQQRYSQAIGELAAFCAGQ